MVYRPPAQNPVRPIRAVSTSLRFSRNATANRITASTSSSPARWPYVYHSGAATTKPAVEISLTIVL